MIYYSHITVLFRTAVLSVHFDHKNFYYFLTVNFQKKIFGPKHLLSNLSLDLKNTGVYNRFLVRVLQME